MSSLRDTSSFKKVLVIDDNEVDRYMAGRCIEKYGFAEEWVLKESASKALVYLMSLENHPHELPELIFLAVRMPETDGFIFMEHYQKLSETIKSNCKIVILTSSQNYDNKNEASDNNSISRFINKPLDREKLQKIILEVPARTLRKQSHAA